MMQWKMNFLSQISWHYLYVLQVFSVSFTSGCVWTELQIFSITQTWLDTGGNNELHHFNHAKSEIHSLLSVLSHKVLQQPHEYWAEDTFKCHAGEVFTKGSSFFSLHFKILFLKQWKMPFEMNNILENTYFDLCGYKLKNLHFLLITVRTWLCFNLNCNL